MARKRNTKEKKNRKKRKLKRETTMMSSDSTSKALCPCGVFIILDRIGLD